MARSLLPPPLLAAAAAAVAAGVLLCAASPALAQRSDFSDKDGPELENYGDVNLLRERKAFEWETFDTFFGATSAMSVRAGHEDSVYGGTMVRVGDVSGSYALQFYPLDSKGRLAPEGQSKGARYITMRQTPTGGSTFGQGLAAWFTDVGGATLILAVGEPDANFTLSAGQRRSAGGVYMYSLAMEQYTFDNGDIGYVPVPIASQPSSSNLALPLNSATDTRCGGGLAVGDLDGDYLPDLVVHCENNDRVRASPGTGGRLMMVFLTHSTALPSVRATRTIVLEGRAGSISPSGLSVLRGSGEGATVVTEEFPSQTVNHPAAVTFIQEQERDSYSRSPSGPTTLYVFGVSGERLYSTRFVLSPEVRIIGGGSGSSSSSSEYEGFTDLQARDVVPLNAYLGDDADASCLLVLHSEKESCCDPQQDALYVVCFNPFVDAVGVRPLDPRTQIAGVGEFDYLTEIYPPPFTQGGFPRDVPRMPNTPFLINVGGSSTDGLGVYEVELAAGLDVGFILLIVACCVVGIALIGGLFYWRSRTSSSSSAATGGVTMQEAGSSTNTGNTGAGGAKVQDSGSDAADPPPPYGGDTPPPFGASAPPPAFVVAAPPPMAAAEGDQASVLPPSFHTTASPTPVYAPHSTDAPPAYPGAGGDDDDVDDDEILGDG